MKYRVTEKAKNDLIAIRDWYLPRNAEYCRRMLARLKRKFQFVSKFPYLSVDRSDFAPGIRSVVESECRIFFVVLDKTVDILRVIHGSQNVTASSFDINGMG